MRYEMRNLNEETIQRLIELSQAWEAEACSYGIVANTAEDITEPLCVAIETDKIIGYIFGHYYVVENKTSYIEVGEKCFMVDELYVLPEYRSQGVGRELFRKLENEVKDSCAYITLSTSTKDYKKILHFYVDEVDMGFHSAFLIKPMNIPPN
ncbi:MAG: GNAT family N-acetyltransferase [Clostridia bacterium]|nr:GNAT family N-acetyltransferase [Clostridia bacterium]